MKEAVAVANAIGLSFNFEDVLKNVHRYCAYYRPEPGLHAGDDSNKRLTEVDRINGAIVSEAAKIGMKAPLNEMLTNLIHAKEELY